MVQAGGTQIFETFLFTSATCKTIASASAPFIFTLNHTTYLHNCSNSTYHHSTLSYANVCSSFDPLTQQPYLPVLRNIKKSLLNMLHPLTALASSSMGSVCISTFISFISGSLSSSIHSVDDNVNSFSVIKMLFCALYDNFDPSCSINTYGNFFSLLRPYFLFNPEKEWVKYLQICRHFLLGLLQTSTGETVKTKMGSSSHPVNTIGPSCVYQADIQS